MLAHCNAWRSLLRCIDSKLVCLLQCHLAHAFLQELMSCRITDAGVNELIVQSQNLQQISLYWNVHVTDAPLCKLALHCAQLTHLNLSGCKRITDKGLMAVAKGCHQLMDLDLTRCVSMASQLTHTEHRRLSLACMLKQQCMEAGMKLWLLASVL